MSRAAEDSEEERGGGERVKGREEGSSNPWIGKTRDDVLKELAGLRKQRQDVEGRLKTLDRDVRNMSRPNWREGRRGRDIDRPTLGRRRYDRDRDGRRRNLVSEVVSRRRRRDDDDDDETDDDGRDDRRSTKKRKLYIRKGSDDEEDENGRGGEKRRSEKKPSGISSVAVVAPREGRRKPDRSSQRGNADQKRNRRLFGFLMGHLGKAKKNLEKLRTTKQARKKKSMEEKAEARMVEVRQEARSYAKQKAEEKRMEEIKARAEILKKQRKQHLLLLQLRLGEHEKQLSKFIRTVKNPPIYWLPSKHNKATEELLEVMQEQTDRRIKKGLVAGFDDEDEDEIPEWKNTADKGTDDQDNDEKDDKEDEKNDEGDKESSREKRKKDDKAREGSEEKNGDEDQNPDDEDKGANNR
mmetsp:Transcript_16644/g.25032  ORF Transcript_16644/g.25032 Transcript_16644/m.25032 type:complete len:411 (+) Transcript_16644:16-1248(+)